MSEASICPQNSFPRRERRVAVRVPSAQETGCHFATIDNIQSRFAKIRDLSPAGISIIIDHPFETGQRLVIELPDESAPAAGIAARVVRVVDQKDGTWLIGCWFGRLLSDEEYRRLQ